MNTRIAALAALTAFCAGPLTADEAKPDPKAIIAKYLETIGGIEAQKKLTTRKMEGEITIDPIGARGTITIIQKAPDKIHNRVDLGDLGIAEEGTDGKLAWKKDPGQPLRRLEGEELRAKLREARFYSGVEMFAQGTFSHEGRKEVDGRSYDVLTATFGDDSPWAGTTQTFYFDTVTASLDRMEMPVAGPGEHGRMTIKMGGQKKVDGVSIPMTMEMSIGGQTIMTMNFDKVTHGIEVEDTLFAVPTE